MSMDEFEEFLKTYDGGLSTGLTAKLAEHKAVTMEAEAITAVTTEATTERTATSSVADDGKGIVADGVPKDEFNMAAAGDAPTTTEEPAPKTVAASAGRRNRPERGRYCEQ